MSLAGDKLARALSAPARRHILRVLVREEKPVGAIAEEIGLSFSLASRHLTFLYDLGLLSVRREAQTKYYSLKHQAIKTFLKHYDALVECLE